jgi:DNA-binding NarL/FixJ family response regulator
VLADDHALFREGTRQLLERDEELCVVGEAANGVEAVELVDRTQPDVAIIDIEMPEMDGIEATRRIKERHPRVAVLVLTVHDEDPMVLAILEAGAAGYLLKDVHSSQLIRTVKALHAGESVLHPAITKRILDRVRTHSPPGADVAGIRLSDDERMVLRLAARGMTNREIATELAVSTRTIQLRLTRLFETLNVGSRTEAVVEAIRANLITLDDVP